MADTALTVDEVIDRKVQQAIKDYNALLEHSIDGVDAAKCVESSLWMWEYIATAAKEQFIEYINNN